MATLLDVIQKQKKDPAVGGGQAEATASLLRAKSGKAGGTGSTPKMSTLQESQAVTANQAAQGELAQQAQTTELGLQQKEAGIKQQESQEIAKLTEKSKDIVAAGQRQTAALLGQLARGNKKIESSREISDIEKAGFMVRLDNEKYVDQLNNEAALEGLEDDLQFKNALARSEFAGSIQLARDEAKFLEQLNMDYNEFEEYMGNMSIEDIVADLEATDKWNSDQAKAKSDLTRDILSVGTLGLLSPPARREGGKLWNKWTGK